MKKIKKILILAFTLCLFLTSGTASAVVVRDENSGWEFETTQPEAKRDVYGSVSGISNLSPGDSVGVFDKSGSCYGIGKYNGVYYFVSAFGEDAGSKGVDYNAIDDYPIQGFKNGDEVVFKVYTNVDGKVYTLKTSDNQPLIFTSVSGPNPSYPSRKVDLAYKAEDTTPTTPPVTPPTPPVTPPVDTDTGGGGSVILGHLAPAEEKEKTTTPSTTAVITEPKKEETAAKEPYYAQILEKEPVDYYTEPAPVPGTTQRFVGGPLEEEAPPGTTFYEPEKEEGKKFEVLKAQEPEIAKKKRHPLWLNLLLLLLLLLLLIYTAWKALKKEEDEVYYNEDKESEDSGLRR